MKLFVGALLLILPFSILSSSGLSAQGTVKVYFEGGPGIQKDTILFSDLATEQIWGSLAIGAKPALGTFHIDRLGTVAARLKGESYASECLLIWEAGKEITLQLVRDTLKPANLGDSLFTSLWPSTNAFLGGEMGRLFRLPFIKKASTPSLQFANRRQAQIDSLKERLSLTEYQIISHWNQARIYSFLFYAGRMQFQLPPGHPFFQFTSRISPEAPFAYTYPSNLLYKYEIEYLQKNDSIESLPVFLDEIEARTPDRDLTDYLKVFYLKELTELPSYWRPHQHLFDALALKAALESEAQNPYFDLLAASAEAFFNTSTGKFAPPFSALNWNGDSVQLSDWRGKVVFLDVWASWCAPCIQQRPFVLDLAKKYKGQNVVIAMLNFDRSIKQWKSYVNETNPGLEGTEVFIPGNVQSAFAEQYNIHFVPRYILIDTDGRIVNGNVGEPSKSLIRQIDQLLEKTD